VGVIPLAFSRKHTKPPLTVSGIFGSSKNLVWLWGQGKIMRHVYILVQSLVKGALSQKSSHFFTLCAKGFPMALLACNILGRGRLARIHTKCGESASSEGAEKKGARAAICRP
jgi:hypothetical protein